MTQNNLIAKLPTSCQVLETSLKYEYDGDNSWEWLSFFHKGKYSIDKSRLPQNITVDDWYHVRNSDSSFIDSLYFLTKITKIESTDLPARFVLNETLLVGEYTDMDKFSDIVQKENLELPKLNHCLINIKGICNYDIEKLLFILQRTGIKTVEMPEHYVEEITETLELKDTSKHFSSFIGRLETEKFTVIRKGLTLDQVESHQTPEILEKINRLLQNSNIQIFQFPIDYYRSSRFAIYCDGLTWSLKLAYLDNYEIDYRYIKKVGIHDASKSNYKKLDILLDEMSNPMVEWIFFEGMENDVEFLIFV